MPPAKSSAKRKNASMACVSCRESKVKCDGAQPTCSSCINKNRKCRYQSVDRRKLPLRVAIELLSSRVDQLCHFICENGLEPPPMPQEKDSTLTKVLKDLELAEINAPSINAGRCEGENFADANKSRGSCQPISPPIAVSTPKRTAKNGPKPSPTHLPKARSGDASQRQTISPLSTPVNNDASALPFTKDNQHGTGDRSNYIFNILDLDLGLGTCIAPTSPDMQFLLDSDSPHGTIPTTLEEMPTSMDSVANDDEVTLVEESGASAEIEDLVDELSDRVGTLRIGPGGKTHFYGPTSTFNLADVPLSDDLQPHFTPDKYALQDSNSCEADIEVPMGLEEHLINLYFSWQDPSFHVVDREMYEEAKAKRHKMEDTPFFSGALRNAMCALGSAFETRFHPTFVTYPKTLVDFFGDRAKSLLESELDYPCVATVQAMVILSSHEIGNGKDARGWLYSGMAIRLAFDLALHLDMSEYVSKGFISAADADLRRTIFWAAYVVDHQLGFYLGRPFRTNMEDVTVGKPSDQVNEQEPRRWVPYILPAVNSSELPDCTETVSQHLVSLCDLMAPCGYFLYGTPNISKAVLQELNEKVVLELRRWKAKLPPMLQINLHDMTSPYLPHVLLLHMQYYQNMIYAHRPWMSKSHIQPQPPKGPGYLHAREMCIQSAIAISKILVLYETQYTLRYINAKAVSITSSAVLLLLFAAVSQYPSHSPGEIAAHLSTCFRALDEFALSWHSARRGKDLLVSLQRRWEVRTYPSKLSRRRTEPTYIPRKRSRASNELPLPASLGQDVFAPARLNAQTDFQIDSDLDWMLMADGQFFAGSYEGELSDLIPDSTVLDSDPGGV
ncbi:hypothetical protein NUU61_006029 [Penicillium alfredii]|uniref:Zn(2)-C6 fungal-type domain-containing protein n=1 Tax=Penicillium alfredii TaxID=1506179 RepID=A0A9W9F028_9EURO|nr:uncharacterized protein NUU61_006029 [Penicillium alfredii]KAJ5091159.1 hypothetical protein NUU61_006029 [Penicillium alfredii]